MRSPSTTWQETIGPGEPERHARQAEVLRGIQTRLSARQGAGRAAHRKQVLGLRGSFEVLSGLPAHARQGLFAKPATYGATIRLSNASLSLQPDRTPDIRGFAIRVEGLQGQGALGIPTTSQSFVLTNHAELLVSGSAEFVGLIEAVSRGNLAVIGYQIRTAGLLGALRKLKRLAATLGKSFTGFATERFYSGPPLACGPYAARVRILPAIESVNPDAEADWAADVRSHLAQGPVQFDLQLQFYVDPVLTPIEDPSVAWPEAETPYVTVARLTIPPQEFQGPATLAFAKSVEASKFDPWWALAEHRPLGEMMRARKAAYLASQQGRGAV